MFVIFKFFLQSIRCTVKYDRNMLLGNNSYFDYQISIHLHSRPDLRDIIQIRDGYEWQTETIYKIYWFQIDLYKTIASEYNEQCFMVELT